MKQVLLDGLNDFYKGQVKLMQADVEKRHREWISNRKKGPEPMLNLDSVKSKGRLTRIFATFPYLKVLQENNKHLSFTHHDILGNPKGKNKYSKNKYENFLKYDQTINFLNLSPIVNASKIKWLKIFIQDIFKSKDTIGRPDKLILFLEYSPVCWHLFMWLEKKWPGKTLYFHHKIKPVARKQVAQPWMKEIDRKEKPTPRILLTPTGIGGEGLNLTRARYVVLLDMLHDPGKQRQAFCRAAREGNLNPEVTAYQLYIEDLQSDSIARGKAKIQEFLFSCGIKGVVAGDTPNKPLALDL
ncbi:hypothetical protein MMC18_008508 [Xylographa bjoerkii]|nr:hypothetical protein [Xylographa bjoerkii]